MVSLYKHHIPSTTSLSDDPDDIDIDEDSPSFPVHAHSQQPARWLLKPQHLQPHPHEAPPISTIPPEILIQILKYIHSPRDLYSCVRVSRTWCECAVELLWHKPSFPKYGAINKMATLLRKQNQTFTYARFIRRLNFLNLGPDLLDNLFSVFSRCERLERLTLIGCKHFTGEGLAQVLPSFPNLVAIDLSGVVKTTSDSIIGLASVATRLQGINLTGCAKVTDSAIIAFATSCPLLRRVKLGGLKLLTDESISAIAQGCPMLLELELNNCELITDVSMRLIWTHLVHMREMRLSHCSLLTEAGFPAPVRLDAQPDVPNPFPTAITKKTDELPPLVISRSFEHLRMLDLTACPLISDEAVEGIVSHAPKIRNLVLSKCVLLTDKAVESICKLGRYLHYLHLGHASKITDRSVRVLARSCTRIRYIDFANCVRLTDMSVFELSALPKLRRIGLVRANQLTDEAIYALAERHATLERIHLSYCDQISVMAIHFLLLKLHKLTHLSLTGVPAFQQPELQQFCREPPDDFNTTQRQAFCVFSCKGVSQLRTYLTELFDRITEMNNTDDTEYEEDEFDGDAYQEDDTPEPENDGRGVEGYPRQNLLYNPNVTTTRGHVQAEPLQLEFWNPAHEFAFRRDRPARAATIPMTNSQRDNRSTAQISPSSNLRAATSRLNAQIQSSTPTPAQPRLPSGHAQSNRTVADVLPLIEASVSPPPSDAASNHSLNSNGATFFRGYHERPTLSVSPRGNGALTPDLNYAEIGHGRGAQAGSAEGSSTVRGSTVRGTSHRAPRNSNRDRTPRQPSSAPLIAMQQQLLSSSSHASSESEEESPMRHIFRENITHGADNSWAYREDVLAPPATRHLPPAVQSASGTERRGRREQAEQAHAPERRARSVKRSIRNTFHAAEHYANSLLFGRHPEEPHPDGSAGAGGSHGPRRS
ncbi:hypothetical protein B0H34DRAFT_648978 [Crassisporium funariophilum]|nr:hypothetical protein B0H34DRAFT_648978 [Crassisporium funariophilum]